MINESPPASVSASRAGLLDPSH